ncbi:MAG: hypothetical protein EA001_08625 [Oscillatoriales cyanobacterium]|nr:MAG: hypothetical protein EA001_08625 [Oscillatoriales cyanobacterium]
MAGRSRRWVWCWVLVACLWFGGWGASPAWAGPLVDRVTTYPYWTQKPPTQPAKGDLTYPDWMAGTWQVTSELLGLSAPFAPEIVTPGFESNRSLLGQPMEFTVRFSPQSLAPALSAFPLRSRPSLEQRAIVADRAFNGLNIAAAYLGREAIAGIVADPGDPNHQTLQLKGQRELRSEVTGRASERPGVNRFVATETSIQSFGGGSATVGRSVYRNLVETTTDYRLGEGDRVTADQFTAIYLLSPDRYASVTRDRPVALYHYRLTLQHPADLTPSSNS